MKIAPRMRRLLIALVAAASAFVTTPANAATGTAAVAGTGSFSPGLNPVPGPQTMTFGVSGAIATTGNPGVYTCSAWGGDSTVPPGYPQTGGFIGSCTTPCGDVTISASYTRADLQLALAGSVTSGCLAPSRFAGDCPIIPTTAPETTSYATVCDFNFDSLAGTVVMAATGWVSSSGWYNFSFSGTGVGTAGAANGTLSCTVTGNDFVGTWQQSVGDFTGSCTAPCGTASISGSHNRILEAMTLNGSVTSGCLAPSNFTGDCSVTPLGALVATSFAIACEFTLD